MALNSIVSGELFTAANKAVEPGASLQLQRRVAESLADRIADTLSDVGTGHTSAAAVRDGYRWAWRMLDVLLARLNIDNPNPYRDIWEFVEETVDEEASEANPVANDIHLRKTVRRMHRPLEDALAKLDRRRLARSVAEILTGWPAVDEKIERLREQYAKADSADDWRDVGRSCDGLLEAVGKAATESLGDLLPETDVSPKDAKGRIKLILALATGPGHQKLRKLLSESESLAQQGTVYLEAVSSLHAEVAEVADAADRYANKVKHSAKTEHEAGIAADSVLLLASIVRHAVALIQAEAAENEADAQG